jgi:hypothetical protein
MTGTTIIISRMDNARSISEQEQRFAAIDGKTGRGGCDQCHAIYTFAYAGEGIGHLTVAHHANCPIVAERMRNAFMSNSDPGDEQP